MKHIALNIDEKYVGYCCVFIASCLKYNDNIHFHILHNGLSETGFETIKQEIKDFNANVSFYLVESKRFVDMPVSEQWPEAIYYRILIPELLSEDIEMVLYCDCDVMIRGPLEGLWANDISNYAVGAVEDVLSPISPMSEKLGCKPENGYFNSGVLLINNQYWKDNKVTDKTLNYIKDNANIIKHPDQDALNYVLNTSWKKLSYKWNFLSAYQNLYYSEEHLFMDYNKTIDNFPIIIHFSGIKPWSSRCRSIYKYEYFDCMKHALCGIKPPKLTVRDHIEYFVLKVLDYLGLKRKPVNYFK